MSRRFIFLFLLLSGLTLVQCAEIPKQTPLRPTARVTIVQMNDVYRISPVDGGETGGLARVAAFVKSLRSRNPSVLFLHAGDAISPSLMSRHFQGRQMIEALNQVGLDAITPGNHELDQGRRVLVDRIAESKFTWVSSNVRDALTDRPFPGVREYLVLKRSGVKIGIFGLTTTRHPADFAKLEDPLRAAGRAIKKLDEAGVDLVIALTHLSMDEDRALAKRYPRIDLIVGGHEHDNRITSVGATLITKADADARTLVLTSIEMGSSGERKITAKVVPVTHLLPEDPAVARTARAWEKKLSEALGPDETVARTEEELIGLEHLIRRGETNLGDLITDAIREETGSEIAVLNSGAIRINDNIPPGPLMKHKIDEIFLFDDTVVLLDVAGATLREMLERSVDQIGEGGFLQVSGLAFLYDPLHPSGKRVTGVSVGGSPLRMSRRYRLATIAYVSQGGDGYKMLKGGRSIETKKSPEELVIAYLKTHSLPNKKTEVRIVEIGKGGPD